MAPAERPPERKTAFVSYAQSSSEWRESVFRFITVLRRNGGVKAELDMYHDTDHQQWTTFGPGQIERSDFILIAIDAAYKRRWIGTEKKGVGAGAAREAATIKAIFERDQEEFVRRVKVVLLPGIGEEDIPDELYGICQRYRVPTFDAAGIDKLVRSIYGMSEVEKVPVGDIPTLPPLLRANLEGEVGAADAPAVEDGAEPASVVDERDEAALRDQLGSELPLEREVLIKLALDALAQTEDDRRRARRLRYRAVGMAAAAGVAVLAAVALVLYLGGEEPSQAQRSVAAASGELELRGPPGWRERPGEAVPAGLGIEEPVKLAPDDGGNSEYAAAGISAAAAGRTLLPAAYRSQLSGQADRQAVDLGSLQAYRYTGLRAPSSGAPLTVFVSPTSHGVATLACGAGAEEEPGTCGRIASTLRLAGGTAYRLGPSATFSQALRSWLDRLDKRRREVVGEMKQAADGAAQGVAAERLATAFASAATGLQGIRITPQSAPARDGIVAALRSVRDSYEELATAAREEDSSRYAAAKGEASAAEAALNDRIADLRQLGYEVAG